MTDTVGFPEAAVRFGVPLWVLRRAIHNGKIPAPPSRAATAVLPAAWLSRVEAALAATPDALSRGYRQKVPPFARYVGTSAWRKYANRVREYNHFKASLEA